jgi:peptide deformylase
LTELLVVRTYGDPILREVAKPVEVFDDELALLLHGMHATMDACGAKGIAGNQVGVLLRVFAWRFDEQLDGSCVNPMIALTSEQTTVDVEGCLSFPRMFRFNCERPALAQVDFQDVHGEPHSMTVTDRLARTFLHEIDHLNGILFLDHLAAHDRARADELIAAGALDNIPQPYADGLGT